MLIPSITNLESGDGAGRLRPETETQLVLDSSFVPVSAPHRGDLGLTPPGYDLPPLRGSREEL